MAVTWVIPNNRAQGLALRAVSRAMIALARIRRWRWGRQLLPDDRLFRGTQWVLCRLGMTVHGGDHGQAR